MTISCIIIFFWIWFSLWLSFSPPLVRNLEELRPWHLRLFVQYLVFHISNKSYVNPTFAAKSCFMLLIVRSERFSRKKWPQNEKYDYHFPKGTWWLIFPRRTLGDMAFGIFWLFCRLCLVRPSVTKSSCNLTYLEKRSIWQCHIFFYDKSNIFCKIMPYLMKKSHYLYDIYHILASYASYFWHSDDVSPFLSPSLTLVVLKKYDEFPKKYDISNFPRVYVWYSSLLMNLINLCFHSVFFLF